MGKSAGEFFKRYGDKAKAIGVIVALVASVGGAIKWVYDKIDSLEDTADNVAELQTNLNKLKERVKTLEQALPASEQTQEKHLRTAVDATRKRFLEDERAVAELRGTVIALVTEVRIRHRHPDYLPTVRPSRLSGGSGADRVRVQIRQNRLAAEALDQSIGRTIDAIPQKAPFAGLDL